MSDTTVPILAVGGITMANRYVFNDEPWEWTIPLATGVSVGLFALFEKAMPDVAVGLAWLAVFAVCLTRVDPKVPSAAESALNWFEEMRKA